MSLTTVTDEPSSVRACAQLDWSATLSDETGGREPWLFDLEQLSWTSSRTLLRCLGSGGQGVVFLSERRGANGFVLPVAMKFFSPEPYVDDHSYDAGMARIAQVAARVAEVQQDHLVDIQNFIEYNGIRMMEMEWIDGHDLHWLLRSETLGQVSQRVDEKEWAYINDVIVAAGPEQARVKPGIAVALLRQCLGALAALHRAGVVHSDVKPSNIMVKRTGSVKIIDIGSAFAVGERPREHVCTLAYAAPEVLAGSFSSPQSDLASLGYVLIELLAGRRLFGGSGRDRLAKAKKQILGELPEILPAEVLSSDVLMSLIHGLAHPEPGMRFPRAETAEELAARFQTQLVKGNLASEYESDIRSWVGALK